MATVSVIVPFYNREKYLASCLECLDNQTWQDLELIFVDDGSTDAGPQLIASLIEGRIHAKLIRKSNTGMSDSRRVGLGAAHGKYVYFLNAEDFLFADAIETAQWLAENCKLQAAAFSSMDVRKETPCFRDETEMGREYRKGGPYQERSLKAARVYSGLQFVRASLLSREGLYARAWLYLFRRDMLLTDGIDFDAEENEDFPFVMDALLAAKRVCFVDKVLHCRRLVDDAPKDGVAKERRIQGAMAAWRHAQGLNGKYGDLEANRAWLRRWSLDNAWLLREELVSSGQRLRIRYKYRALALVLSRPDILGPKLILALLFL